MGAGKWWPTSEARPNESTRLQQPVAPGPYTGRKNRLERPSAFQRPVAQHRRRVRPVTPLIRTELTTAFPKHTAPLSFSHGRGGMGPYGQGWAEMGGVR